MATLIVSFSLIGCLGTKPLVFDAEGFDQYVAKLPAGELNDADEDGYTPLHTAAEWDRIDMVRLLLAKGADTRAVNAALEIPLHVAIRNDNVGIAQLLAAEDGDLFIKNKDGISALELGMKQGKAFYPALLTESTAAMRDSQGQSVVHYLVENKDADAIDWCIQHKLPLSARDKAGMSPLHLALKDGENDQSIQVAVKLLLAGAAPVRGDYNYFEEAVVNRNPSLRFDDGQTALHLAATQGKAAIVRYLVDRGAAVGAQDSEGATVLHEAVRYGHTEIVDFLLKKNANPNIPDRMGKTPLLLIIPRGKEQEIYSLLLENGANPMAKDMYGDTVLHIATMNNVSLSAFTLLAEKETDVNERNKQGVTPLAVAVEHQNSGIVNFLASRGADIHAGDFEGKTPLTRAFGSSQDMISLLLNSRTITTRDSQGNTPLHIAVLNSYERINDLIKLGSDVNARNHAGDTPLALAIQRNQRIIGENLLSSGAQIFSANAGNMSPLALALSYTDGSREWILTTEVIRSSDGSGNTPLHYAAEWKNDHAVSLLLAKDANPNAKNVNGQTPIFNAVRSNSPSTIRILVNNNTGKDNWDSFGNTPLHTSVHWDAAEAAECLIRLGANIETKNRSGKTPLGDAVRGGKTRIAELFIMNGADINAADASGKTILFEAIQGGNTGLVKLLLERGASPQIQEMHGQTAYHEAVVSGDLQMISLVRDAGANPLAKDTEGRTPLSMALAQSPESLRAVLKSAANLVDSDGNTALHIVIQNNAPASTVEMLVQENYPLNRRNRFGETPLMTAVIKNAADTTAVLLRYGSDPYTSNNSGECAVTAALKGGKVNILNNIAEYAGTTADIRGDGLLHYAAQMGDRDTIQKLIGMGQDKFRRNISGETPYDVALRWQKNDVAALLQ
jgi:ankyrin repeat protein